MKIVAALMLVLIALPPRVAAVDSPCDAAADLAQWVYFASRGGQKLSEYVDLTRSDPRFLPHQKAYFEAILLDVWPDAHNLTKEQARTRGEVMCFKHYTGPVKP
ncbi:MAG: hypothetical protein NTW01_03530 [Gammaproteobacteria bacterium]|nr:hypothetical protein [Gammaproteobacteria bacterium]